MKPLALAMGSTHKWPSRPALCDIPEIEVGMAKLAAGLRVTGRYE